jgi:PAS domain-containing protein
MRLGWLIESTRETDYPADALRRRLLLGLMLAMIGLGSVGILTYELTGPPESARRQAMETAALAVLIVTYLATRFGSYRFARATVLAIPVVSVVALSLARSNGNDWGPLSLYLLISILLGAALLSLRGAAVLTASLLALTAVLPAVAPAIEYRRDMLNQLAYLAFMGGLVLIVAHYRERLELVRKAQLYTSEQQYRLLAENSIDIVFQQDMSLAITYVSPAVEQLTGYTVRETRRAGLAALLTPESLERALHTFGQYVELARQGDVQVPLM